MKLIYTILFFSFFSRTAKAQTYNPIEVGKASGNEYIVTQDTALLHKALQFCLSDGTLIQRLHIESVNAFHYLVGEGTYKGHYKMIAVALRYEINTRTYYAEKGLGYVSCSSAACDQCEQFREKGQIIGCRCAEKSTISNQCNFTRKETSLFYDHLRRLMLTPKKPK